MWPECPSSYLHDKRTMHYSCIKTQYKLHLIKSFSLWNNAVSAVEAAKNLELQLSMDVLKRNVQIYMKHCALHRTGYWLNGNLQYNSSFNHLDWKKKKDKVALNGNKTQFNHENSFHIETKIEFKIRLLVEIKNIHIYIYTHKVQTSSGTEDPFAAHANLLSTACIPWMRVLQWCAPTASSLHTGGSYSSRSTAGQFSPA